MTSPEDPPISHEPSDGQSQAPSQADTTTQKAEQYKPIRHEIRDWLMFGVTLILVVATIFYVHYAKSQRDAMLSQTNAIIAQRAVMDEQLKIMNGQLKIMNDQLVSIQDQADSMRAQTRTLNDALDETRKAANAAVTQANASLTQSKTSQVSARAAQQSAAIAEQAFTIGERPYMSVKQIKVTDFEKGKSPSTEIIFTNSGKTPALNVRCRSYSTGRTERRLGEVTYPEVGNVSEGVVETQGSVKQLLTAMSGFAQDAKDIGIEETKQERIWFFVYGLVDYDDGASRHHTLKFCFVYNAKISDMEICEEHNASN